MIFQKKRQIAAKPHHFCWKSAPNLLKISFPAWWNNPHRRKDSLCTCTRGLSVIWKRFPHSANGTCNNPASPFVDYFVEMFFSEKTALFFTWWLNQPMWKMWVIQSDQRTQSAGPRTASDAPAKALPLLLSTKPAPRSTTSDRRVKDDFILFGTLPTSIRSSLAIAISWS